MTTDSGLPDEQQEHPFAPFVRILGRGRRSSRSLTEEEAYQAMSMILDGQARDVQVGAFLTLLRVKEETPEEIAGFVRACRERIQPPPGLRADLDWSSYAGKRRHLPWFLLAVLVLAQRGIRVFIHGTAGHTPGRLYTSTALQALGFSQAESWQQASDQLDRQGFCYLPLDVLNPRLQQLIDLRSLLGLRSPVHSLARMLNPLDAPAVLQGVFHPPYVELHRAAGQLLGYHSVTVLKGEGGEIERNPDARLVTQSSRAGTVSEEEWPIMSPERHPRPEVLELEQLVKTWRGEAGDSYGERAVLGTLALALRALNQAADPEQALRLAEDWWHSRDKSRL